MVIYKVNEMTSALIFYRYIMGYYTDLFILVLALTLWSASYSFAKSFGDMHSIKSDELDLQLNGKRGRNELNEKWAEQIRQNDWQRICMNFKAIRVLSFLVNKALGSNVCWFLGDAILAYSLDLDTIFTSKDYHKRVGLLFNYFCAFGVLFVSADICKQVNRLIRIVSRCNEVIHSFFLNSFRWNQLKFGYQLTKIVK